MGPIRRVGAENPGKKLAVVFLAQTAFFSSSKRLDTVNLRMGRLKWVFWLGLLWREPRAGLLKGRLPARLVRLLSHLQPELVLRRRVSALIIGGCLVQLMMCGSRAQAPTLPNPMRAFRTPPCRAHEVSCTFARAHQNLRDRIRRDPLRNTMPKTPYGVGSYAPKRRPQIKTYV